jgi:mRNA interferase MazF
MMPDLITYKRGDVVFVPFPYTDLSTPKQRPAVVISADWFNASCQDVIIAAITSQNMDRIHRDEYRLTQDELRSANIPFPSKIKVGKLFTIEKKMIIKKFGDLSNATLIAISDRIKDVLCS